MMAAETGAQRQVFIIRDHKGNVARTSLWLQYSATAGDNVGQGQAYAQDIYALQTGDTKFAHDGATPVVDARGPFTPQAQPWSGTFNSTGDYFSVEDKMTLNFITATGAIHRVQIPAPLRSLFLADQETVDKLNVTTSQFVADVLQATYNAIAPRAAILRPACDRDGVVLVKFIGGFRLRRKMQRKVNIYTLSANLDEPAE